MTQEQYNLIVKIVTNGAPALAGELLKALDTQLAEGQHAIEQLAQGKEADNDGEHTALDRDKETT